MVMFMSVVECFNKLYLKPSLVDTTRRSIMDMLIGLKKRKQLLLAENLLTNYTYPEREEVYTRVLQWRW